MRSFLTYSTIESKYETVVCGSTFALGTPGVSITTRSSQVPAASKQHRGNQHIVLYRAIGRRNQGKFKNLQEMSMWRKNTFNDKCVLYVLFSLYISTPPHSRGRSF